MFNGFAKRIEALEKQISVWESKARKDDKWKKCLEMWLLKNFDFDIQENISKLSDIEDTERCDLSFDDPVITYNNSFQLAPKQVYNNPHLIVESRSQVFDSEHENSAASAKINLHPNDNEVINLNSQNHSHQFSQIKPAHLNSQPSHSRFQPPSYRNIINQSRSKEKYENPQRTSAASLGDRKSSLTSSPVSLEKVPTVQKVPSLVPNPGYFSHVGSSITLTPLPLPPPLNSQVQEPQQLLVDNDSAIYLSNNMRPNVSVGTLMSNKDATTFKEEVQDRDSEQDLQEDEWHAAAEDDSQEVSSQFHAVDIEIHKHNTNYEGSSEGRNSSIDLDTSDDIEEFSVDTDEHKTVIVPGLAGELQEHLREGGFKGGTGFFSNPKNLPICNFCGKTYSSQTYLKTHIDVVHKGMKAFRCKLCGVCFGFKSDLTRHLRSHLKRKTSSL